ncbi:hypothetical protein KKD87_02690 [bacterium]|nr:hypothetical protein [bacterium]
MESLILISSGIFSLFILIFSGLTISFILKLRIEEKTPAWLYFQWLITTLVIFLFIYSSSLILKTLPDLTNHRVNVNQFICSFMADLNTFFLILVSLVAFSYKELKMLYQAMELEKIKSEFMDKISHELRTPLTSTKGAVELLSREQESLNEKQRQLVGIIERSTNRLIRLINDLLDFSKTTSGKIELILELDSLSEVVDEVVKDLILTSKEKHLALTVETSKKIPPVFMDKVRIGQVLNNLIENAIKFTPHGGSITISLEDRKDDILCSVSDTSMSISPLDTGRIFTEFHKTAKIILAKGVAGVGLGLPLSKAIIRSHRGEIWVESVAGKGNKFIFSLPKEKRKRMRHIFSFEEATSL